ncbi:chromatin assembly factor 1 subunit B [Drosophila sulfurigaster albostrigata]|uniref:chromatin assembly factor 1 subunit B n=1 Tax=Drosophila sulfurigaster albostrigata TaxID=89887 RepID=UPI002D218D3E|nr:chromatin assembly factor 1 subunit B [Drosophila sulfurigaster albostrigata]
MKCKIPEISWHNRDPVLSVDIQPKSGSLPPNAMCRLASGGTDTHVLIWYLNRTVEVEGGSGGEDMVLELAADLTKHQRAVNTVRWSPNGELLASGDDDSVIFLWVQKAENDVPNFIDSEGNSELNREMWRPQKVLRGHREDVYDLCWAPNSQFLLTGSVDNTAMLWDVHKGKSLAILDDHKGYVQGVAWDPANQYLATMSTDRNLRIFDVSTRRCLHRVSKTTLPVKEGHELHGRNVRLYHDGTLQTFFRRICFTPDAKMLLTPAGVTDYDGVLKPSHTTYGYSRYDLSKPAFVLPFPNEYTVAVRCSPVLYRLRPFNAEKNPPIITLPYRMIYAVATKNSVFFFDTQQPVPFAIVSNIHYTRLTDMTWSNDGNTLIVSSTDGFCSLISFHDTELGERYEDMEAVLCAITMSIENAPQRSRKIKKQRRKPSTDESTVRRPLQEKGKPNIIDNKQESSPLKDKDSAETDLDADNDSSLQSSSSATSANSPKPAESTEKEVKPTPIAFRRSPRKVAEPQPIATRRSPRKVAEPQPIATRRSPRKVADATPTVSEAKPIAIKRKASEISDSVEPVQSKPKLQYGLLPKPIEAVLDRQIISSDEKFELPEKQSRPVTPIQVRRQPRTPGSSNSNTLTPKSLPARHATPIAVRRTPRVLVDGPAVNAPVVVEEAMDAWPLEEDVTPLPNENEAAPSKKETKSSEEPQLTINEATCERTEDIRLVYEDTQEGTPVKAAPTITATATATAAATASSVGASPKPTTPNAKTPRRVSLRTISTPKSKKKLLD